jgi:hypothetical protein
MSSRVHDKTTCHDFAFSSTRSVTARLRRYVGGYISPQIVFKRSDLSRPWTSPAQRHRCGDALEGQGNESEYKTLKLSTPTNGDQAYILPVPCTIPSKPNDLPNKLKISIETNPYDHGIGGGGIAFPYFPRC